MTGDTTMPFKVALSYPCAHRPVVEQVAVALAGRYGKPRVFFDRWHEELVAGVDADLALQKLYEEQCELMVLFLCQDTNERNWPRHEYRIARSMMNKGRKNVLFVTLDGAHVEGMLAIDIVVDGRALDASQLAELIIKRLGGAQRADSEELGAQGPRLLYRIGQVEARARVDLLGGGDETFGRADFQFEYQHEWIPLDPEITARREAWLAEQIEDARAHHKELFNGPCMRLHSFQPGTEQSADGSECKRPILSFRPTCWFDHIVSNRRLDRPFEIEAGRSTTLRALCADEAQLLATRNIADIHLSNILTVSVVLVTPDGWTIIGRRTNLVDNTAGQLQATAAENVHRWKDEPSNPGDPSSPPNDLVETARDRAIAWDYRPKSPPDPFHTALRGLREEVGEETAEGAGVEDVTMLSLSWNWAAFNPHLFALVRTHQTKAELSSIISAARARDAWEVVPRLVRFEPAGELRDELMHGDWADVSKAAVMRALVHELGYREVERALR